MQIFDLKTIKAFPYEEREKNVFYKTEKFKTRIIALPPGGKMPECEMSASVIFYVLEGEAEVEVNQEKSALKKGQCLITEPATLSMKTNEGVKIVGIQIG